LIFNIRGTSGSGKTTIVRQIIDNYDIKPVLGMVPEGKKERIISYKSPLLTILGSYVNVCGGCDTFSWKGAANYIEEEARRISGMGSNVLLEGLVQTAGRKRWEGVNQDHPVMWVFIDTPLEVCIERVLKRNGGREGKRNWENLRGTYADCLDQLEHVKKLGLNYAVLDHNNAYAQMVQILRAYGAL